MLELMTPERGQIILMIINKYRAAAIQFAAKFKQKSENIHQLAEMCMEAAQNGAKLIVLPEMATTGYCFYHREEIKDFVEPVPGQTTKKFEEIAKKYSCYIVVGLAEVDPGTDIYYNTCVLIGPGGIVGKYRKTHLWVSDVKWAKDGDLGFPVFETEIGKIGCLICMDYYYIEPSRIMSLQGAEVLCNPTAWPDEKCPAPAWFSRAWENGIYLISANRWDLERGSQFAGGSSIVSPNGQVLNYLDAGNGIVYSEIDLEKTKSKQIASGMDKINDRQPAYYKSLNINNYLYNPFFFHRLYDYRPLPAGREALISVFQFYPEPLNLELNLKKIKDAVQEANSEGTELLVLPELALSGAVQLKQEAESMAEEFPSGRSVGKLLALAAQYQINLLLGVIEKEQDNLYNTIVLVGPEGIKGKYHKIHLNKSDRLWAKPGDTGFDWVDLPFGRIGLLAGDDLLFPETGMSLAVQGADILGIPACINEPKPKAMKATKQQLPATAFVQDDPIHWHLMRVRAVETNTYLAFANQTGKGGMGCSGIFGPTDWPRQETVLNGQEKLISCKVDTGGENELYPDKLVRVKDNVRMRLPHLYDRLLQD